MTLKYTFMRAWLLPSLSVTVGLLALPAGADVDLGSVVSNSNVSLFGDLRIRGEADDSEQANGNERDRERFRYRGRLGVKFSPAPNWTGRIRLATNSGGLNSPHVDFNTSESKGADIGIDQIYLTYTANEHNTFILGKAPLNFWNTTETFWDADINSEGFAWVYNRGGLTFNTNYSILEEGGWGDDTSAYFVQGIYDFGEISSANVKVALGNVTIDAPANTFVAENHLAATAEVKAGAYRFSVEFIDSDAEEESSAYTLQARYKINNKYGLRAYWFHTEAFSVPGDGTFGQDDFPNPGSTGVSNFKGFRVQFDYKVSAKMSFYLKYFDMERIVDVATLSESVLSATTSDAIFNEVSRTRLQFDLNYKF